MPAPSLSDQIHQIPAAGDTGEDRMAQLDELRRDLAAVVADAKRFAEVRVAQAEAAANDGLDIARDTIRAHPMAAIAVATLLGAAVAVALTPASRKTSNWDKWVPGGLTTAHVQDMIANAQRSVSQSAAGSSMASALERVVESVSSIDPNTSLTPALEKAGAWLSALRNTWTKT